MKADCPTKASVAHVFQKDRFYGLIYDKKVQNGLKVQIDKIRIPISISLLQSTAEHSHNSYVALKL